MGNKGLIERISWGAIASGIVTGLALYFGLPEYVFDIRPKIEKLIGIDYLCFIEGAICGVITTIVVLKTYSYFSEEKKPERKLILEERKLVEPAFVKEVIQKFERVGEIFLQVVERGGGLELFSSLRATVGPSEQEEFKKHIDWLAENYPRIAPDTRRAIRADYIDPILKIRVRDYDPILQIINQSSLTSIVSGTGIRVRTFYNHWLSGRARLLAYLGMVKQEREMKSRKLKPKYTLK